jgi:hypothetical protein
MYNIDVDVQGENAVVEAVRIIREVLRSRKVPSSTLIKQYQPSKRTFTID